MSDQSREHFEKLKEHVANMPSSERDKHAAKGQAHDGAIFDMIKKGDGVGLYASVQKDPSLLKRQDKNGMTPLHWSSADRSGLAYEIFTSQPNQAPWMRDKFNRLPLDVAKEAGREKDTVKMQRVTYPQLFKHESDSPENPEKINGFYEKHKEVGRVDTKPRVNQQKEQGKPAPSKGSKDKGRER